KTAKGYVTANKNYVVQVTKAIEKYFIENPHKITMLVEDRYYSDLEFLYPGKPITKGMSVDVMDIEYSLDGVPRFKTKDGYLTANKSYITAAGNVNNNYFVTSPQKVKFLTNDFYYKDIDFKQRGNAIKSGSILEVEGIEYTLNGVPRLKIAGGYITANKWYVEKIK
ncbi:glycosyl hydrolase family 25, partial [Enterococcus hirae]